MVTVSPRPTKPPTARDAAPPVRVTRITFADETAAAGRRHFTQPRRASAVEEDVPVESVTAAGDRPEAVDQCLIVCAPAGSPGPSRDRLKALLASPRADASRTLTLEHGSDSLEWRPGVAVVQCRDDSRGDIVAALVDFAFYEGHLRLLEHSVEEAEAHAEADVGLAHRVRYRDRAHWARLTECAERCSRMRLTYARLEPQLLAASPALTPAARSWMTRLLQRADMELRLESLSDRLEALEELYEGATQRVAEHRWYVSGHALEIGIIALLLVECAMMGVDIYLHNRGRPGPDSSASAPLVLPQTPRGP